MPEILDTPAPQLPNSWYYRNPIKAGLLLSLVLLIGLVCLSWYLRPAFLSIKVDHVENPEKIKQEYGVFMWVWTILVLAIILLPPIVTQYLYWASNEVAKYANQLNRGATTSYIGLMGLFIIIDNAFKQSDGVEMRDVVFGLIAIFFMAIVVALIVNMVLSFLFRKSATDSVG